MIEHIVKANNASTLFLLTPVTRQEKELLNEYQLINSYLRDKDREDLVGDLLFVLFKPTDLEYFELFTYTQAHENEDFLEDYDYAGGYVVIVYRIPQWLKEDFEKFKRGEYSKFSDKAKGFFRKMKKAKGRIESTQSIQWDVFNKETTLRKDIEKYVGEPIDPTQELWPVPNMEKETLNILKFRKNEYDSIDPSGKSLQQSDSLRGGKED